ncbi:hypothetical protein MTO96_026228, partial [Rhipicephalus appendiculatus]
PDEHGPEVLSVLSQSVPILRKRPNDGNSLITKYTVQYKRNIGTIVKSRVALGKCEMVTPGITWKSGTFEVEIKVGSKGTDNAYSALGGGHVIADDGYTGNGVFQA